MKELIAFATSEEDKPRTHVPTKIVWNNVLACVVLHVTAPVGLFLSFTYATWKTVFFAFFLYIMSIMGITAGAHRLWSHKAYKAKLPFRILLAFLNTCAYQGPIYWWVRDHRSHHRFTETNADPYSAKRGFFFCHIGWLMSRKHPDVIEKGKSIDISDILTDPVVVFQKKYYTLLVIICWLLFPTLAPTVLWGEKIFISFLVAVSLRYVWTQHMTFLVNSVAHMWGNRPYSKRTESRENFFVNLGVVGEGFHNYHHTFPWDYAASEFGTYFNISTAFINLMAWFGLAYDLRTVSREVILKTKEKLQE